MWYSLLHVVVLVHYVCVDKLIGVSEVSELCTIEIILPVVERYVLIVPTCLSCCRVTTLAVLQNSTLPILYR